VISVAWQPPPTSYLKCNVNVVFFNLQHKIGGFGMCLRDEKGVLVGEILLCRCMRERLLLCYNYKVFDRMHQPTLDV